MIHVDISNIWGELSLRDLLSIEAELSAAHMTVTERTGAGKEFLGWLELADRVPTAEHLRILARLIKAGYKNLKGYYYWNDADSYEELDGYNLRFGLTYVDHETGQRRWKKSRYYYAEVCKNRMVN